MARMARVIAVDTPHHVTQRGNARQVIFCDDEERAIYLKLLHQQLRIHDLALLGYCLMPNHVHLIVVPRAPCSLALALKETHGKYASFWNAAHLSSGHVWQGRFYSCPLDQQHLWIALRYVELNPVRAGLASNPTGWRWSSAALHYGESTASGELDLAMWSKRWCAAGGIIWLAQKAPPICAPCANVPTRVGHSAPRNSFVTWRSGRNDGWRPEKVVAPRVTLATKLRCDFKMPAEKWKTSRLSPDSVGSVDQTKTFVLESNVKAVGRSQAKSLKNWDVTNGNDTMVSLLNLGEKDENLVVTMFFDGGHYKVPVHLNANASIMLSAREIVTANRPDLDGNEFPQGTGGGTAVLSGSTSYGDEINVAAGVGILDVTTGTCGNTCPTCLGATAFRVQADKGNVAVGQTAQFSSWELLQNGVWVANTLQASWTRATSR